MILPKCIPNKRVQATRKKRLRRSALLNLPSIRTNTLISLMLNMIKTNNLVVQIQLQHLRFLCLKPLVPNKLKTLSPDFWTQAWVSTPLRKCSKLQKPTISWDRPAESCWHIRTVHRETHITMTVKWLITSKTCWPKQLKTVRICICNKWMKWATTSTKFPAIKCY